MNTNTYDQLSSEEIQTSSCSDQSLAIAYAAAKAREVLGSMPEKISVSCSRQVIQNLEKMIVPNSEGLRGIDVAATLAVVGGKVAQPEQVLENITSEEVEKTRLLLSKGFCTCLLSAKENSLFIRIYACTGMDSAAVEITGYPTNITLIEKNSETLFKKDA
jgi:L-cysteine desulfidase